MEEIGEADEVQGEGEEVEKMEEMEEVGKVDEMEEMGKLDEMEEMGKVDEMEEMGKVDEMEEMGEMGVMGVMEEMEEMGEVEEMGMAVEEETWEEVEETEEEEEQKPPEPPNICDEFTRSEEDVQKKKKEDEVCVSEQEGEPAPLVLDPNHPMMKRFQEALRNYLLKQLNKLSDQLLEMDNDVKAKEREREETGEFLYDMQREVFRQQKILEDCENYMEKLTKERQELDESVKNKKLSWKEEVNNLNSAKKKESEMMAELHRLSSLEKQMETWKKDMESELTLTQRISEKTHYDKNKLIEEKRKMDMYLLRLMAAVSNSEWEMRLLEGEIDVKLEEKDSLNQTLADATADLQCLITEQKRLLSAWNSVVCTINHRNILYSEVNKELTKCQENFQSLNAEIQSYKRSAADEMKKNENLAIIFGRLENEYENLELQMKNLSRRKEIYENQIVVTTAMISNSEEEHQKRLIENESQDKILTSLLDKLQSFSDKKRYYEDEIVKCLHEQILTDSTTTNLGRKLTAARELYRKQEFNLLELENKISKKFLEVEEMKEIVARNNDILKEASNEFNNVEEELKKVNDEIAKCQSAIIKRQENYATLMRKFEKNLEVNRQITPEQQQIMDLEKSNAEIQTKNDKLQSFWLIQQNNNMKLTKQRQKQLKDLSLLRRQVLLLEQGVLKVETEFDAEKKIENDINRSIIQQQHKLTVLNEILVGKKGYKDTLGKENTFHQAQYLQNLKDAELEQIRLKAEIKDLEKNLEELADAMLSTQREMLVWEKKIQSALEAKADMQKERSGSGELAQMKAEIHRMEVRHSHLKRIQDKLIMDLELCVLKRDLITNEAEGREKRQAKGYNPRHAIQKKIDILKNNIRQSCNEQKQIEKFIENTREGHNELKKAILEKEGQLLEMQETTKKMNLQLEDAKLLKCQNLEMLIRRQKKCKLYELLKTGKHRLLYKTEAAVERELQKAKYTNADLISVMEALIENFPAYRFQLKKIYNTLQAKSS